MASVADVLNELVVSVGGLQKEMQRLNNNLENVHKQQESVTQMCKTWNGWIESSEFKRQFNLPAVSQHPVPPGGDDEDSD